LYPLTGDNIFILVAMTATLIISLVAICIGIALYRRMKRFEKAYVSLQTFLSGNQLENLLQDSLKQIKNLSVDSEEQKRRLNQIEVKLRAGIDRAELVKFNSFDNLGAELSFALALLNQERDGVILTAIHSLEECRIYAKEIEAGQAKVKLIPEEKLAIEKACHTVKV
jgi:hypothetical protein